METKICRDCNKPHLITDYPSAGLQKGITYYKPYCKDCRNLMCKKKRRSINPKRYSMDRSRKCKVCREYRLITLFRTREDSFINGIYNETIHKRCSICEERVIRKKTEIKTHMLCKKCKDVKPVEDFREWTRKTLTGTCTFRSSPCKKCLNKAVKFCPGYKNKCKYDPKQLPARLKWAKKNKEKLNIINKKWYNKAKSELTDVYLKILLSTYAHTKICKHSEVPQNLIKIKRKELILTKTIKYHGKENN